MNAIVGPRQIQERSQRVRPCQAAYTPAQSKARAGREAVSIRYCRAFNGGTSPPRSRAPLRTPIRDTQAVQRRPAQQDMPTVRAERMEERNQTGVPLPMLERAEKLSGMPLRDVRVHYGSPKPAALGALAFTQGSRIFLGPGQERHLGHELGHVVQQKRGMVRPEFHLGGVPVNASPALEGQADRWGALLSPLYTGDRGGPVLEPEVIQRCTAAQCFDICAIVDAILSKISDHKVWRWIRSHGDIFKSSAFSAGDSVAIDVQSFLSRNEGESGNSTKHSIPKRLFALVGVVLQLFNLVGSIVRAAEEYEKPPRVGDSSACWRRFLRSVPCILMFVGWLFAFTGDVLAAIMPSGSAPAIVAAIAAFLGVVSALSSSCQACCEGLNGKAIRGIIDALSSAVDLAGQILSLARAQKSFVAPITILIECAIRIFRWIATACKCSFLTDKDAPDSGGSGNGGEPPAGGGNGGGEAQPEAIAVTDS